MFFEWLSSMKNENPFNSAVFVCYKRKMTIFCSFALVKNSIPPPSFPFYNLFIYKLIEGDLNLIT